MEDFKYFLSVIWKKIKHACISDWKVVYAAQFAITILTAGDNRLANVDNVWENTKGIACNIYQ